MLDKDQKERYSQGEKQLLRDTFAGDDTLLHLIRKVLLQQSAVVQLPSEVLGVVKKVMFGYIDQEVPIEMLSDMYYPLLQTMGNIPPEIAALHIEAKDIQIEYMEQQFRALSGEEEEPKIVLSELKGKTNKGKERRFVDMFAYCNILAQVQTIMGELKIRANQKELTEEEKKKMNEQNSNK